MRNASSRHVALGVAASFWMMGSVANNILTKAALRVFPFPFTLCLVGLLVQTVVGAARQFLCARRREGAKFVAREPSVRDIFPAALCVTSAFVFHRVALKYGSVALTITVKSTSTVFVAALSRLVFKETLSSGSVFALVLIVSGVCIASVADAAFEWTCFFAALSSGLSVSAKVIINKLLLVKFKACDPGSIYLRTMLLASFLIVPICILFEGSELKKQYGNAHQNLGDAATAALAALSSGAGLAWMEAGSFILLNMVTPVSHAVFNGMRSLAIIAASTLYFGTPMPLRKVFGVGVVISGCVLYALGKAKVKSS
eukprot:g636.t1